MKPFANSRAASAIGALAMLTAACAQTPTQAQTQAQAPAQTQTQAPPPEFLQSRGDYLRYGEPVRIADAGVGITSNSAIVDISPSGERVLFQYCEVVNCTRQHIVVTAADGAEIAVIAPSRQTRWLDAAFVAEDAIVVYEPRGLNDVTGAALVFRIAPDGAVSQTDEIPALRQLEFSALAMDGAVVTLAADAANERIVGVDREQQVLIAFDDLPYRYASALMAGDGVAAFSVYTAARDLERLLGLDPHIALLDAWPDSTEAFMFSASTQGLRWDGVATFGADADARLARIAARLEEIKGKPLGIEEQLRDPALPRLIRRRDLEVLFPDSLRFETGDLEIEDVSASGDLLVQVQRGATHIVSRDGAQVGSVTFSSLLEAFTAGRYRLQTRALADTGDIVLLRGQAEGEHRREVWYIPRLEGTVQLRDAP